MINGQKSTKKKLLVISYDHNLRKDQEKKLTVKKITLTGWKHKTLIWTNPSKKNIFENARIARYQAISEFCKCQNIDSLLSTSSR